MRWGKERQWRVEQALQRGLGGAAGPRLQEVRRTGFPLSPPRSERPAANQTAQRALWVVGGHRTIQPPTTACDMTVCNPR